MTWGVLFDRAAAYEVTVAEIRTACRRHREDEDG